MSTTQEDFRRYRTHVLQFLYPLLTASCNRDVLEHRHAEPALQIRANAEYQIRFRQFEEALDYALTHVNAGAVPLPERLP